jgi:PhnB protein
MQFCLHYGEGNEEKVRKAYEVLKLDAEILLPLAPCGFSSLITGLVDKFGIRWCLFV